jgi:hypothetical protein
VKSKRERERERERERVRRRATAVDAVREERLAGGRMGRKEGDQLQNKIAEESGVAKEWVRRSGLDESGKKVICRCEDIEKVKGRTD